jgi:hypothetical protein
MVKVIELASHILRSYKGNTSCTLGVSALSDSLIWGICVWDVLIRGQVIGLAHCMLWSYDENTPYTPGVSAWSDALLWSTSA